MTNSKLNTWLDRPVFSFWPKFTIYHLIVALILITAVLSRFIMLGERVMSHDEVNHVVPAYTYYTGGGYRYDPVTHGPLQFHIIALSYTLFGDSDFSARIPDAVFGIGVILFAMFAFKKYLGRVGSLVAGFLFTISPFISFYSRYTRNEIYIVFWGMALLWGVLRYLELGHKRTLLFVTIITALHFTDKATSYIFTAEMLIFLAVVFFARTFFKPWKSKSYKLIFLVAIIIAMIAGMGAFGVGYKALTNARGTDAEGGHRRHAQYAPRQHTHHDWRSGAVPDPEHHPGQRSSSSRGSAGAVSVRSAPSTCSSCRSRSSCPSWLPCR